MFGLATRGKTNDTPHGLTAREDLINILYLESNWDHISSLFQYVPNVSFSEYSLPFAQNFYSFFLSLLHLQEHKYTYRIPGERGGSCTQELMELETSTQQLKLVYKFHIFSSYFPHNYRLPWILSEGSHLLSMQRAIIFQVKGVS